MNRYKSRNCDLHSLLFFSIVVLSFSCKKLVEVDPPKTQLSAQTVFTNDASALSAISGLYADMMSDEGFASLTGTVYPALSADEFKNYSPDQNQAQFYSNSLLSTNSSIQIFWGNAYNYIYQANTIIEGLVNNSGVSVPVKNQLIGEAKFIRAFCHFYLTNLFGDIPLVLTSNYQDNSKIIRTPKSTVLNQIISDLNDAGSLLASDYSFDGDERARPNKWAAVSLLARVNLFLSNWSQAEKEADSVINQSSTYLLVSDLNSIFLKNSMEAIWQLSQVHPGYNTWEGNVFILVSDPGGEFGVAINDFFLDAFEIGDNRFSNWIGTYISGPNTYQYAYKYKVKSADVLTEYSMVLRLSEQYLIRAEARAEQNDLAGATSDLNVIRNRAGLANTTATTQSDLLIAILHERQIELFGEWGHRWLDLKRTGMVDSVMTVVCPKKGSTWNTNAQLYPIPQSERLNNPNLTQNPGY